MINNELKKIHLLLLGSEMGLVLSQEMNLDEIESFIRNAAKSQPFPESIFSKEIAIKYGIEFTGELIDCFGLYDSDSYYCCKCNDCKKCMELNNSYGIQSLKITSFTQKSETYQPDSQSFESNKFQTDHDELIDWLSQNKSIVKRIYKNSISFSSVFSKKIILKVEKFKKDSYPIIYHRSDVKIDDPNIIYNKSKNIFKSKIPDLEIIKGIISKYFDLIDVKSESENSRNNVEFRRKLINTCVKSGLSLKEKLRVSILTNFHGRKVIHIYNFSKGFLKIKINKKIANQLNIVDSYKSSNTSEIEEFLLNFLEKFKTINE